MKIVAGPYFWEARRYFRVVYLTELDHPGTSKIIIQNFRLSLPTTETSH